jgi:hypothetical protein
MASSTPPAANTTSPTGAALPATPLELRKTIYSHDRLTPSDMNLVFAVAQKIGGDPSQEWTNVLCEAMTDYLVHQNVPRDYIPQEKADWFVDKLAKGGGMSSKVEFAILIDVMTHAVGVPASLSAFALREIKTAIMSGRRNAITDEKHPAGVVTKADVDALRAVLYAATTGTACHVTQEEAEALFEIAHAVSQADPSFDDLFARAVGNYLMAISLRSPDKTEALHFEKWLDEKGNISDFLSRMVQHGPEENSFNMLQSPGEASEADLARRDAEDDARRGETEKITDSEAAWVMAHLNRQGKLTSAEMRLLRFLETESPSIAPSLRALVGQPETAGTFGRR